MAHVVMHAILLPIQYLRANKTPNRVQAVQIAQLATGQIPWADTKSE